MKIQDNRCTGERVKDPGVISMVQKIIHEWPEDVPYPYLYPTPKGGISIEVEINPEEDKKMSKRNICKTCKHWVQIPDWDTGACDESEGTMMNTSGKRAHGVFLTGPEDSCMWWEATKKAGT